MQKTRIDWATMTWNPVTGCLNNCDYCYARKIAQRFGWEPNASTKIEHLKDGVYYPKADYKERYIAYPFGFKPTFHEYRLDEPQKIKKPQNIFVCSMGELFGDWIPDEWIQQVFEACYKAPQHRYLFLTKYPQRYAGAWLQDEISEIQDFSYFGVTATNQNMLNDAIYCMGEMRSLIKTFLSIEPTLERVVVRKDALQFGAWFNWCIIGAETGNRKDKVIPKREWIESIVEQCRSANVPMFLKNNLKSVWGDNLIQEYPWKSDEKKEG